MSIPLWAWLVFNTFVLAMLALDLGVFHRRSHVVGLREALTWSGVWITLALAFNAGLYFWLGLKPALEFLTGYLIEKSLSVDNVFVFAMLFAMLHVPKHCEHKVLFWGIFGALVMRAAMIFAGVALIEQFHWLIYVFGAFLVIIGLKMLRPVHTTIDPERHPLMRLSRRFLRITPTYEGDRFVVWRDGRLWATPLLLALVMVESSDLVFAVDSIPAILAVSNDSFIIFTSNVFAMLGLRALYFAFAGLMESFRYLKHGLAAILAFVGLKMMLTDIAPIPISISLAVVVGVLAVAIAASLWRSKTFVGMPDPSEAHSTAEAIVVAVVPESFLSGGESAIEHKPDRHRTGVPSLPAV